MKEYMSLKDYVYNYISEKINNGELSADDKITEIKISEELNVSRTPIREALIQLSFDGYLENMPRKGFKIKPMNIEKAIELYEIIGALEGKAASLALDHITNDDIQNMEHLIVEMDKALCSGLYLEYHSLQLNFDDIYISRCTNVELIELIKKLKKRFIKKNYSGDNLENISLFLKQTNEEHKHILDLIKKNDKLGVQIFLSDVHWNISKLNFNS